MEKAHENKHLRVDVMEGLYIYKQPNSSRWYARFKHEGRWLLKRTGERDQAKAIVKAIEIRSEAKTLSAHGIAVQSHTFKHVAELAIERMKAQPKGTKGYASMKDYEAILNNYHIPYFDRTFVTSIDRKKLDEFNVWRAEKNKGPHSTSTLKSHNAALSRVFDEAVIRKYMHETQRPVLSTEGGVTAQQRDYFTVEEFERILKAFPAWINAAHKQESRDIRWLLMYYFKVAVLSGLRPGTEMDNLKWTDIEEYNLEEPPHIVINVRKGKTTLHTGTRRPVCDYEVFETLQQMNANIAVPEDIDEKTYDPPVFRLPNGEVPKPTVLTKNFTNLLKKLKLKDGPSGERTLYSTRHTYITFQMLAGVSPSVIGKQVGTGADMIQLHYSHIVPKMFVKELIGMKPSALAALVTKHSKEE